MTITFLNALRVVSASGAPCLIRTGTRLVFRSRETMVVVSASRFTFTPGRSGTITGFSFRRKTWALVGGRL